MIGGVKLQTCNDTRYTAIAYHLPFNNHAPHMYLQQHMIMLNSVISKQSLSVGQYKEIQPESKQSKLEEEIEAEGHVQMKE